MRLVELNIRKCCSIKELDLEFPESGLLVLVGANNAGKSNVIRSIDAICGDLWFGREKLKDHDHYLRDKDNAIRIGLDFDNGRSSRFSVLRGYRELRLHR